MFEFFQQFLSLIWNLVKILSDSIINGFQFLSSTLLSIPNFILELFTELPTFIQIGISGVFCLLICVVILKIVSLVK